MTSEHQDRPAIQTPDQRLRVFVSSTLTELVPEREAVARAITALRLTPVMFELGARPHPPQELYRAYLAQSDIFIGLYWERYGWIGPGMDISGLEDEYQRSTSLPRLMYVKLPAPNLEPRLAAMIADVEAQGVSAYRTFTTPRELGRIVRDDLALLLSERFTMSNRPTATATSPTPEQARPHSLPATATSLIGREADIVAVTDLLEDPHTRLVTLTGPGGIGKTRLSVAVGDALSKRSDLAIVFVPLASVTEPVVALQRIAAAVGATIEGNRSALDALSDHFLQTPTLLILDNLEQVVTAAPELDRLLSACPALKILATSRTVLRLRAEHEYTVAALTVPAVTEEPSIDNLAALAAVQLFVDRAQAVRRDFALTPTNAASVAQVCRRLDGLPLAIELAAARTRLLEPAALLGRLERVLDTLGTGPVDLPERQRTLRATVEWSVDLLDAPERDLLFTLSVFADGWTVDAATAVSGETEDQALDLLDALAGHSLVSVDAAGAVPRFRMLVSVRELAAERLGASGRGPEIEARHAAYFAALVERDAWPAERQTEWAARWRIEEENLRVAIRLFFTNDITPLPGIFRSLWLFWQMSDRMPEGRAWVDELRARSEPLGDRAQAEILFTWAVTAVEVGDDASALVAIDRITKLSTPVDDPYLASSLQLAIAWTLPITDDFDGALTAATNALDGFRKQNKPFVAFAALTVGMLEMTLGHVDVAQGFLHEVRELGERFDNIWLTSSARTQLATLAVRAGQLETARHLLTETVESLEGAHLSTLTVTFALVADAQLAFAEGDTRRAAIALDAVDALRQRAGLLAWPLTRRDEADLRTRLAQRTNDDTAARAFGTELTPREALALVSHQAP